MAVTNVDRALAEPLGSGLEVPTTKPPPRSRIRFLGAASLLSLAAGIAAMAGSALVLPFLSQNSDEGAYLFQSTALRAGQLMPTAPGARPASYQPWFSVIRDGHFVFKYSPVHAGVLALVPRPLGGERAALGLIAAAAVFLLIALSRELGASRRAALTAGVFFALSPLVLVQSTTFLPYLDNLAILLAFAVCITRGCRTGSSWLIVAGGLALGLAFWARPYDTLLFATPIVVWQGVRCSRRDAASPLPQLAGYLAIGVVPGLIGFFGYNAMATGSALHLPFRLQEQFDTIGFGNRRTNPLEPFLDYTPKEALQATRENLRLLLTWSFGSVMLVLLGYYGAASRPKLKSRWLLLVMFVTWPIGFFFFWGSFSYIFRWDGSKYLGPYYYLPMLVPLAIAAGVGFEKILRRVPSVALLFVVLATVLVTPVLVNTTNDNLARTAHRRAVAQPVRAATRDTQAMVFVPGVWGPFLQHPFSFLRNTANYNGDVVYALESGNRDLGLARQHPGRSLFTMSLPDGYQDGTVKGNEPIWVDPASLARGASVEVGVGGVDPAKHLALRIAYGAHQIQVPIGASGSARATLRATPDGLAMAPGGATSSRAGEVVTAVDADAPLVVSIVRPLPSGSGQLLQRRLVPIRAAKDRIAVLWPGTVDTSVLSPATQYHWSASASPTP